MAVLVGTFTAVLLCALALGLGSILGAKPLQAGCGRNPAGGRCAACPNRERGGACDLIASDAEKAE